MMTRGGFLKAIGLGWVGQSVALKSRPDGSECVPSDFVVDTSTGKVCLEAGGTLKCGPGEERCPLGHCQAPDYLDVMVGRSDVAVHSMRLTDSHGNVMKDVNVKVCSTCGIAYVPPKEKP
jgi:hypothetical protein